MTRTLIIGLDGATWDMIKPLADGDKLPTFKKLRGNVNQIFNRQKSQKYLRTINTYREVK